MTQKRSKEKIKGTQISKRKKITDTKTESRK